MDAPRPQPAEPRLRAAEQAENFPVAMRVLPARYRSRLRAVYDVVRVIDDLGDEGTATTAQRITDIRAFAADLALAWEPGGPAPHSAAARGLVDTVRACGLPREPFDRLVEANVLDQSRTRYRTWDELLGYCELSAVPIGRLVLAIFDVPAPPGSLLERESDLVCSALQVLEHCQDVAEDRRRGRIYLPGADLATFGVSEDDLGAPPTTPELRRLIIHETGHAVAMLDEGAAVLGRLRGWARLAVAGYVAGGRAAADALRRARGDVLAGAPRARRRDVARHLVAGHVLTAGVRSGS